MFKLTQSVLFTSQYILRYDINTSKLYYYSTCITLYINASYFICYILLCHFLSCYILSLLLLFIHMLYDERPRYNTSVWYILYGVVSLSPRSLSSITIRMWQIIPELSATFYFLFSYIFIIQFLNSLKLSFSANLKF